jgi:predicted transcriptional regulator
MNASADPEVMGPESTKPRTQTVKLTDDLHIRLVTYGAKARLTNQYILVDALKEYLDRYDGTVA